MILVTGATGFTGAHLSRTLAQQGENVRALIRPNTSHDLARHGIEEATGDLRDTNSLENALKGVDTVYHLAALYRKSGASPIELFETNAKGTVSLLEAARSAGVKRFVHCSTVGVHGSTNGHVADESSPFAPGDPYQESKLAGENSALRFMANTDMSIVIARPAGIYGPGDTRFLKLFKAIKKRRFVMLGSGHVLYQMIHVDDLVDGIILCGTKESAVSRKYILTGDRPVELSMLVRMVAEVVGAPYPRLRVPVQPFYFAGYAMEMICRPFGIDPPLYRRRVDFFRKNRAFSIERAKSELGFRPRISLVSGLRSTALWYESEGLI